MKKIIIFLTMLCSLCLTVPCAQSAEGISIHSSLYDIIEGNLVIKGTSGTVPGKIITLEGYKSDSETASFRRAVNTVKNGDFSFDIEFAELENGTYTVYIMSEEGEVSFEMVIVDPESVEGVLPYLNDAETQDEFSEVIINNKENLGIDSGIYNNISNDVNEMLYTSKPSSGFKGVKDFSKYLNNAFAAALIKSGKDMKIVFDTYKEAIGINYDEEIAVCRDEVIAELKKLISNQAVENAPLCDTIKKQRLLAGVKTAESYGTLKLEILGQDRNGNEYTDNFDTLAPDTTYYDKLVEKSKENLLYIALYDEKTSITNVEKLKNRFEELAKEKYNELKSKENNNNGGGGNAGGSGAKKSSVTATVDYVVPQQNQQKPAEFSDMKGHWAAASVAELCDKEVISGFPDGRFNPDGAVTRAQFAKMLALAFEIMGNGEKSFSDVNTNDWFAPYVSAVAGNGIVNGTADGRFMPDENITREDAAVMIYRYLKNEAIISESEAEFADRAEISDYAVSAVGALSSAGVINGVGEGRFAPKGTTTRAQAAVLIINALMFKQA